MANKRIYLLKQNNLDEAKTIFDFVLNNNKNIIQALEGKTKTSILLKQKNYEEALKCFEELLKLNNLNENYILGKAKCLYNLN